MRKEIGAKIKTYRKLANLTQCELAQIVGVSNRAVSNWESGANGVDTELIPNICKALGITPNDLLDTPLSVTQFSDDALRIARIYDELTYEHSKKLIRLVAEHERNRAHPSGTDSVRAMPVIDGACNGSDELNDTELPPSPEE